MSLHHLPVLCAPLLRSDGTIPAGVFSCRAATIRNIQNRDVDLDDKQVTFRHTKTGKIQVIPLCSTLTLRLKDYMRIRGGNADDFLFCNEYGRQLTENALRLAIERYNRSRGVSKTSFRPS